MEEQIPEISSNVQGQPSSRKWILWLGVGGIVILLCGAVFIGALIFAGPDIIAQYLPVTILPANTLEREATTGNTMGDENAPVHIIEYGDFQCPYCLRFWEQTEPLLIEEYVNTGQVYFEFRAFPIIGPESYQAAEGAYCAGDQDRFWEFHDALFTNWTGENVGDFTQKKLLLHAESLGLDMDQFESCLTEGKYTEQVIQDKAQGEADGVSATPTFIINGQKVEGAQPFTVLKQIIEDMLDGDFNTVNG
jgi:protein-disulfide isomerase